MYTAEEVALIMREKLIRLQSLYIDQFKRLQHLLKEKKRRFLHSRKGEHEAIGKYRCRQPLVRILPSEGTVFSKTHRNLHLKHVFI